MSNRGAYGFVINGNMTTIYCARGADFGGLGDNLLEVVKNLGLDDLMKKVSALEEVKPDEILTDNELIQFRKNTGITNNVTVNSWYELLRTESDNPEAFLDAGKYWDGYWSLKGEAEKFYLVDFDKKTFEVWIWALGKELNHRPHIETTVELISYPLNDLPDSLRHLEEDQWDLRRALKQI